MKEEKTTPAAKVNYTVAERVKRFCRERGLKYGFFVEKAILEQLAREELKEDLVDLKSLREMEGQAVSLDEYLRRRKIDKIKSLKGKIEFDHRTAEDRHRER